MSTQPRTEGNKDNLKKKIFQGVPFIIKVFEKYVKSWSSVADSLYVKPKNVKFNHLLLRPKAFLFETKWQITAFCEIAEHLERDVPPERLYERLRGMSCILESKGLLGRKKYFVPGSSVDGVEASDELSRALNENREIMKLVRSVMPDEMTIAPSSIMRKYPSNRAETPTHDMDSLHEGPGRIMWIIRLTRGIQRGLGTSRKADQIIELLDKITEFLIEKTRELLY